MARRSRRLFLGIDAGGTRTRAICISHQGDILGIGNAGPINHTSTARARRVIREVIDQATSFRGADSPPEVSVTYIGSATLEEPGCEADGRALLPDSLVSGEVYLDTDAYIAWAGAFCLQPGIVLTAGTGSMCLGIDGAGLRAKAGGWGWRVGDEGSAYHIAIEAIRLALKTVEGRETAHLLWEALQGYVLPLAADQKHMQQAPLSVIRDWLYHPRRHPSDFAAFAPYVEYCAQHGCHYSGSILEKAARDLFGMVEHVADQLAPQLPLPVAVAGGVITNNSIVFAAFRTCLERLHRQNAPSLQEIRFTPEVGAALLAMKMKGVAVTSRIEGRLSADFSKLGLRPVPVVK